MTITQAPPSAAEWVLGRAGALPDEPHDAETVASILGKILGTSALTNPRLAGARCAGMAPLFDDRLPNEADDDYRDRIAYARGLCGRCHVQALCRLAATEHEASGVWGGALHSDTKRPQPEVA